MNELWRRLCMLTKTCQHVSLQFVSYAEKDKVFSLFSTKVLYAACLGKPSTETSKGRHQCFSVVVQASPKIRPRPAHDRTTEASLVWMTGGEGWVCWVKCANMWIPASLFSIKVLYASLPVCQLKPSRQKQAYVDISVFGWLRKQRSRFAQDQPKGYFQMKELDRTIKSMARMS